MRDPGTVPPGTPSARPGSGAQPATALRPQPPGPRPPGASALLSRPLPPRAHTHSAHSRPSLLAALASAQANLPGTAALPAILLPGVSPQPGPRPRGRMSCLPRTAGGGADGPIHASLCLPSRQWVNRPLWLPGYCPPSSPSPPCTPGSPPQALTPTQRQHQGLWGCQSPCLVRPVPAWAWGGSGHRLCHQTGTGPTGAQHPPLKAQHPPPTASCPQHGVAGAGPDVLAVKWVPATLPRRASGER